MEAPSSSSSSPPKPVLSRRPGRSGTMPQPAPGRPVMHADIDPAPRPWWGLQWLAIAGLLFLVGLQFRPATHFRHPADPQRKWIPIGSSRSDPTSSIDELANDVSEVQIFTWTDCLDLRVLAVLFNSTLSGSRNPENVFFNTFIPEDADEKLSFHKLKVVFPHSNVKIIRETVVKEKLNVATPEGNFLWSFHKELAPFIIATSQDSTARFLFISSEAIIKGSIEELYSIDLGIRAIGAAEDCSRRLGDYVNIEVLNALQKSAAKSWLSDTPYDESACLLDFSVLLVKPHKLEKTLVESIMWWTKVLNIKGERDDQIQVALALAFYRKYVKLPDKETRISLYDGPKVICSEDGVHQGSEHGDNWKQYLAPKFYTILSD